MTDRQKETACILLAHGSRRSEGAAEMEELARLVAERSEAFLVLPAYLQFGEPDLEAAIEHCVAAGARRVVVAPLFVTRGSHVDRDIPAEIEKARRFLPEIEIRLARHLGADPFLADFIADRTREALKESKE